MTTDATLNASLRRVAKAVRYAASRPRKPQKAKKRAPKIAITPKRRAMFDWLFANGRRYHIEEAKRRNVDGWDVWDLKTNKIITTKPSQAQAQQFVEAMDQ